MAITIRIPGVLPTPIKYRGTCDSCGCQAEWDAEDNKVVCGSDYIKCPTVGCTENIIGHPWISKLSKHKE